MLDDLEKAAEDRDSDRFGLRLSNSFSGGTEGMPKAQALTLLRRYFAGYDSVAVKIYGNEVDRSGGTARIRCVVEFSGNARKLGGLEGLLPPEAVYRFDIQATDEQGVWRVRSAQWHPVEPSPGS